MMTLARRNELAAQVAAHPMSDILRADILAALGEIPTSDPCPGCGEDVDHDEDECQGHRETCYCGGKVRFGTCGECGMRF